MKRDPSLKRGLAPAASCCGALQVLPDGSLLPGTQPLDGRTLSFMFRALGRVLSVPPPRGQGINDSHGNVTEPQDKSGCHGSAERWRRQGRGAQLSPLHGAGSQHSTAGPAGLCPQHTSPRQPASAPSAVMGFPAGSDGKEPACSAEDPGLIPGSGRAPGEGSGYPLQYSGLKNPEDRGAR